MLDFTVLPAFIGVILVFLAPPGPDMTYMLAVGLQGGRAAAIRAILGIGTGMAAYAGAVAFGLGALAVNLTCALMLARHRAGSGSDSTGCPHRGNRYR